MADTEGAFSALAMIDGAVDAKSEGGARTTDSLGREVACDVAKRRAAAERDIMGERSWPESGAKE